jgi:hypothetical protein
MAAPDDRSLTSEEVLERVAALTPRLRLVEVPEGEWRHADRLPDGLSAEDGYRELLVLVEANPRSPVSFSDHHWEDQPVLMHLRLASSRGMLQIVEIQSEWHQKGAAGMRLADPVAYRDEAEARRCAAEEAIDGMLAAGEGAAFVGQVARLRGREPEGARRMAWSALNGNDCGPEVGDLLERWRARLAPLLAQFKARWDACHDVLRSYDAVPLAPMRLTWPRTCLRIAMALAAEGHMGLALPSGEEVAEANNADEGVESAAWKVLPDGRVELRLTTIDQNGNRMGRASEEVPVIGLDERIGEEAADEIRREMGYGATQGEIPRDFFEEREEVTWRNLGLRRFYDAHLPRLLREEGRRAGAEVSRDGTFLLHTAKSRRAWRVPDISPWQPPQDRWACPSDVAP